MEDNDGFIPLKKNENGVFTPVEDDGFIPVTKTSDGIFVSADEKKKSVANQSDTQPVSQVPSERPMSPSSESGQEDKGILNKIGDAFSGAWNKVLSGQGLFGTERETLAQQKQLEQRQNAIDLAIAKRNETERLKNEAVQKSDLVRENLKQYKAESDAVEYAAQFPEYKQLQQIDASISAIGKPSNPQQQAQYNALLAEREKLLDTDVSKRDVFAESGPKLEIKNPSDFATASEYADYQNKLFNQFSRFSKEKEKFDTAKPKFEAATKLRDVLDVAQKSQTKASWIADKVKSIQKESDDYINAARELNKDRLEPLGFTKAFVDGIQQTSLANSIADIYALGNDDKLLKSLENIYIDNTVFPKETTTLGSLGELIGGQVEPLAIGVGGGSINPIAGVVGATAEYARLGAGGQLIDAYNTARQQGMTAPEALEVAKKTAVAGAVGGAAEGLAGATFGGKPAKELATMGFKQAVKEALKDNSIDAVIAGINQTVQNKNMQRLGLDVETDRGVIENMGAELLFGAGMNLAMYGGSKVKGYGTLINGIAKMPLADIQLQVDNAVKQGVLNEANAQRFVADVAKSKEAQDKLQGVDIPEANQDKAIDLQKEIDELEAKKKTASPAILPAIESKVEALTGELQIVAGVPLTMQEKAELNRLQTARDTNTEYDKDRLDVLQKRQKRYEAGQVAGGGVTAPTPETTTPQAGSVVGGEVDLGKNTIIVNMSLPFDSGVNTGLVKNSKGAVYHDRNTSKLEKLGYSKEQIDKLSQAELDEILAKNIENPNVETSAKMPLAEEQTTTQEFLNEASKEGGRFAELAKALKQFFGIDGVETEIVKGLKDFFGKKNDGDYANNKIRIDEKAKNKLQTFLHEAIHKVTVDKLSQFERGDYSKLSKQDIEAIQNLTRIFNESKVKIHEFLGGGKGDRTKGHYGFTNVHEFISEAFTNPEFQSLLKNLPTEGNNPTIFKQFLDAVAKFLGLKDASILNDIFYYTENLNNKAEEDLIRKAPTQYTEAAGGSALKDKKADIERRNIKPSIDKKGIYNEKSIFRYFAKIFYGQRGGFNEFTKSELSKLSPETRAYLIRIYHQLKTLDDGYEIYDAEKILERDIKSGKSKYDITKSKTFNGKDAFYDAKTIVDTDEKRIQFARGFLSNDPSGRDNGITNGIASPTKVTSFEYPSQEVLRNLDEVFNGESAKYDAELNVIKSNVKPNNRALQHSNVSSDQSVETNPALTEAESKDITKQIETFGVGKEQVKPVKTIIEKTFEGLRKAGLTTAKTVGEWVGIGKGKEKPYSLKINGKETQVKNVQPEVVNGFYSPLEKIINEAKQDKMPAKQWAEKYANSEEAKWTGLKDWLAQQQGSVSKADIQQYLKDNRIQVVEVVKSEDKIGKITRSGWQEGTLNFQGKKTYKQGDYTIEPIPFGGGWQLIFEDGSDFGKKIGTYTELNEAKDAANEQNLRLIGATTGTKFSQYQLEGEKENYKEVLVTLPAKPLTFEEYKTESARGGVVFGSDARARESYNDYLKEPGKDASKSENFKSSHFDEPNILVHLRMNTRTDAEGNKVLFLEEVQSDFGQSYKKDMDRIADYVNKNEESVIELYKKSGKLKVVCP